jgi:hypothetical protein
MELEGLQGAVTAVTGFEKGSGKTTFLNLALPYVRKAGPVALFTIGVDGAHKTGEGGAPAGEIQVEPGDVVMTTEAFARASRARFEVLEAVPGRTALGRLLLGRATRAGSVTLVGAEHFSILAAMAARVREEGWAVSTLVDGAVNRLTQVSALGDVAFVFTLRVDAANLDRACAKVRALAALAGLPTLAEPGEGILHLEGPLTAETLKTLPRELQGLSLEDFTKCFLEPADLLRLLERTPVSVRRAFNLAGFAVALRGVRREAFLRQAPVERLLFNPFEVAV